MLHPYGIESTLIEAGSARLVHELSSTSEPFIFSHEWQVDGLFPSFDGSQAPEDHSLDLSSVRVEGEDAASPGMARAIVASDCRVAQDADFVVPHSPTPAPPSSTSARVKRRKSMAALQAKRRGRQSNAMNALRLHSGQAGEAPARDRISALEAAVDRYELLARYVDKLRRRRGHQKDTAYESRAPAISSRPMSEAERCMLVINAAIRDCEIQSVANSSRLYMSTVQWSKTRLSDCVVVDATDALATSLGLPSKQSVLGHQSLEVRSVVQLIRSTPETPGTQSPLIEWGKSRHSCAAQPERTVQLVRKLLQGEVSVIDVAWFVGVPGDKHRAKMRVLHWLSPAFGSGVAQEACMGNQVINNGSSSFKYVDERE